VFTARYGLIPYMKHVTFCLLKVKTVGRASSVGIATRYGLDCPEILSRVGARFSVHVPTGAGAYQIGAQAVVTWRSPTSSSAGVKERVEL
jgi:hypothetical protein